MDQPYVRMNTSVRHHLHFVLALGMCVLSSASAVRAQPDPDRRDFYRTRIQHNPDPHEQLTAITELRRQLPDTADPADTRQRHPTRLARQQEALFLNFLCYVHEARITWQGTCGLQQGFWNYERMVALGPVDGYLTAAEQQLDLAEARSLERDLCVRAFERNGNRLEGLPSNACGCAPVLVALLQRTEEQRRADQATTAHEEAARSALRNDSIQDIERASNVRLAAAIYAPDGRLRCDTTLRISTSSIEALNRVLLDAMFTAANRVFVTGPEADRYWELLANVVQEDRPMVWLLNARKQQDLFRLEDLTMGDFSSNMRARLLPELNLRDVAPFVADGERLVFPYRVMLAPSLTGTNVRLSAEDGYVNILLRPIPEVKKD